MVFVSWSFCWSWFSCLLPGAPWCTQQASVAIEGEASPRGFLGQGLPKKSCSVVAGVLLFISLLSPCCFLALSAVPSLPCQCVPVPLAGGGPAVPCSWRGGGRRRGHHRTSCTLAQESLCGLFPHLPSGDVSADLPSRVARCPRSCAEVTGLCPVLPPVPSTGGWVCPRDARKVVRAFSSARCRAAAGSTEGTFFRLGHAPLEGWNTNCAKSGREVGRCGRVETGCALSLWGVPSSFSFAPPAPAMTPKDTYLPPLTSLERALPCHLLFIHTL